MSDVTIREALYSMQDKEYHAFQSKLLPTIPAEKVIGVRTPALRSFAKNIYGTDATTGRTDYDNIIGQDQYWVYEKGYDRSGYKLDPYKYTRMLDTVGMKDYSVRLKSFYKRIEAQRERLIAVMSKFNTGNATRFVAKSTWAQTIFEDIADAMKALSNAISYYTRLEKQLDDIVNPRRPIEGEEDAKEQEQSVTWTFQQHAPQIRRYLDEMKKYLESLENAKEREAPGA